MRSMDIQFHIMLMCRFQGFDNADNYVVQSCTGASKCSSYCLKKLLIK